MVRNDCETVYHIDELREIANELVVATDSLYQLLGEFNARINAIEKRQKTETKQNTDEKIKCPCGNLTTKGDSLEYEGKRHCPDCWKTSRAIKYI